MTDDKWGEGRDRVDRVAVLFATLALLHSYCCFATNAFAVLAALAVVTSRENLSGGA